MSINKITYCMVALNRLDEMQKAIRRVAPYVTQTCVVDGGSTDGSIEWLAGPECRKMNVRFKVSKQFRYAIGEHTPRERNQYLRMTDDTGWFIYTDSDEFLDEEACRNFDGLIHAAESNRCDGISFRAHDYWTYEDGRVYDNLSSYWNPMMWKGYPGQEYRGHTHSHIYRPGSINQWVKTKFEYLHVKTERRLWLNSTYLYWTTAAPAQNTTTDPTWLGFHKLMLEHGHYDWHEFNKEMDRGNLPALIKKWFIDHKDSESPEERAWFVHYFIFTHPEENVEHLSNKDMSWDYVEQSKEKREKL